jgi:trigger factor
MQVSIETLEGLQRKMTVQLPVERLTAAVDKKLKEISKTVRLDGFRPGKVPVSVVKQKFGGQVRHEVMGDLIESSYREAIVQEKLRPAGMPQISTDDNDKDNMTYSAVFEVYPEIENVELAAIEVEKPVAEIGEEDIDNMIEKLREQRRTWAEVERAAASGDQVTCDFDGSIDGEAFAGGSGKDMAVEIGSGRMLKDFEDGLNGMAKGEEKTIDVAFPDDYHGKEVAGKTAQFVLKVSKVSESVMPELDEEMIKSFGIDSGNLDDFRKEVRGNMEKEVAQKVKSTIKNNVMTGLIANNEVIPPQALVGEEIRNLKYQMAQNMGQDPDKMDLNAFPDDLYREEAEKRVRLGLLVGEVIRIEKIELDKTRFDSALQDMAASYEEPQQVIEYYTRNKDARSSLEGLVLEDQVVDHILGKAKVSETSKTFEQLMNPKDNAAA